LRKPRFEEFRGFAQHHHTTMTGIKIPDSPWGKIGFL
jgi:hypothetical protein